MFKFFNKKDPIESFWQWFVKNKAVFEDLPQESLSEYVHRQLDLVGEQLRQVSDGLLIEVSKNAEGLRDLTITAEGDTEKFEIIRKIVEAAPPIPGWTITAFRQRMPKGCVLEAGTIKYNVEEMFFEPFIDGNEFDVLVYAENLADVDEQKAFHFGMVLMDNLLGEYDSALSVRRYGFRDIRDAENEGSLRPLNELPEFVDEFHRNRLN